MKSLSQWLVFCIIPAFFYGCKDNGETKLPVQTSDLKLVRTDNFEIKASTVKFDESLVSLNANSALVGNYIDPVLGKISSQTYFNFTLQNEFTNFGTNVIVDSVYLEIPYHFNQISETVFLLNYLGDSTANMLFEVYKIKESFVADKLYTPSDKLEIEDEPLAISTGSRFPYTNVYFRVKLPVTFGEEVIANSGVVNEAFRELVKGFCVKVRSGNSGAIYGLQLNTINSRVVIYYQNNNSTLQTFSLYLNNKYFNNITSDKSGTVLEKLTTNPINSTELNGKSFMQGGTGIMTKLTFSNIEEFIKAHPSVIINKAVLKVPVDPTSYDGLKNKPCYFAQLLQTNDDGSILFDISGTYTSVPNYISTINKSLSSSFEFNLATNYYVMDITGYFQDVVLGKKTMKQLLLTPIYGVSTANKSVILADDKSMPIVFEVYYTNLD